MTNATYVGDELRYLGSKLYRPSHIPSPALWTSRPRSYIDSAANPALAVRALPAPAWVRRPPPPPPPKTSAGSAETAPPPSVRLARESRRFHTPPSLPTYGSDFVRTLRP